MTMRRGSCLSLLAAGTLLAAASCGGSNTVSPGSGSAGSTGSAGATSTAGSTGAGTAGSDSTGSAGDSTGGTAGDTGSGTGGSTSGTAGSTPAPRARRRRAPLVRRVRRARTAARRRHGRRLDHRPRERHERGLRPGAADDRQVGQLRQAHHRRDGHRRDGQAGDSGRKLDQSQLLFGFACRLRRHDAISSDLRRRRVRWRSLERQQRWILGSLEQQQVGDSDRPELRVAAGRRRVLRRRRRRQRPICRTSTRS